jgi:hypothetical protein
VLDGFPVLFTGAKQIIRYVRPPPYPTAVYPSFQLTRSLPRPPQPAVEA